MSITLKSVRSAQRTTPERKREGTGFFLNCIYNLHICSVPILLGVYDLFIKEFFFNQIFCYPQRKAEVTLFSVNKDLMGCVDCYSLSATVGYQSCSCQWSGCIVRQVSGQNIPDLLVQNSCNHSKTFPKLVNLTSHLTNCLSSNIAFSLYTEMTSLTQHW